MLFAQEKLRKIKQYYKLLSDLRWKNVRPVENILTCPCEYKQGHTPPPAERFVPLAADHIWGSGNDSHAWFRFDIPAVSSDTFLRVCTERNGWDADNPQFIVYINGQLRQGMDTNHREVLVDCDGPAEVFLYAYTGPRVKSAKLFAELCELDTDVDGLIFDIQYPYEMLSFLNRESDEYAKISDYLFRAVSMLAWYDPADEEFAASVHAARKYMEDEFYGKYCHEQSTTTVCIGHTHIDCAWKWTLLQTREKVQRSFGTVLELMKRYPEYKFMSSQAFLYQNLEEEAPELFAEVAKRIAEGKWECEGAMWVEPDCNLPSGESLVRQVLYGKNYFRDKFGVDNRVLWLPDVFGYSAALPQILRKSGVDWFVTSKISWNDTNRMPYDTFQWRGIDGTEINSYFLTAQDDKGGESGQRTTYVAKTNSPMISGAYKRYQQKDISSEALLTFGFGDGGGGPTREHIELARRGAKGVPGSPNAKIEFAGDFLKRLEKNMEGNRNLPKWTGELYLEFHRGTYTTQANNKKGNRKSEFLYQKAEQLDVLSSALFGTASAKAKLHKGWEMILTNQFHDIIPGSSIREVYEQSDRDYKTIADIGSSVADAAITKLASSVAADRGYIVYNQTSFEGPAYVRVNGKTVKTAASVPSLGYTVTEQFIAENSVKVGRQCMENDRMRVKFDENWQIVSIFDKDEAREVLKAGAVGNELRTYIDRPDTYDAWEWQEYSRDEYRTVSALKSVESVSDGARAGVKIVRAFGKSEITQTLWMYDGEKKIEFETDVDWHERHQMLKAAFPVDILTAKATYEIQFGSIERPTHFNTSWDKARFEVCGHKYADISEGGYGVSMINDCKYGHDIHDSVIQLSLLRSPTNPDEEADQGVHHFTYALCPHTGTLRECDTVRAAYMLNAPVCAAAATGSATTIPVDFSLVTLDCDNVICETVKAAEKGEGTVIRLYESANKRTKVSVSLGIPAKEVFLCDLMENEIESVPVQNGKFTVPVGGFEILTFKIK